MGNFLAKSNKVKNLDLPKMIEKKKKPSEMPKGSQTTRVTTGPSSKLLRSPSSNDIQG